MMPKLDGHETCRMVKNDPATRMPSSGAEPRARTIRRLRGEGDLWDENDGALPACKTPLATPRHPVQKE